MLKVRVRDFRDAANVLRQRSMKVTPFLLAREMHVSEEYVNAVLTELKWLRVEMRVTEFKVNRHYNIVEAAKELMLKGELITCETLAEESGLTLRRVRSYLSRNPQLGKKVGLLGDGSLRSEIIEVYRIRCEELIQKLKRPLRVSDYVYAYKIERSTLLRKLRILPEIRHFFPKFQMKEQ